MSNTIALQKKKKKKRKKEKKKVFGNAKNR